MTLKEKLQKAWENKGQIAEGFYNAYISNNQAIKDEAYRRITICKANTCGYWDETGESDKLVQKGSPGCTGCGCNGMLKTNCMSCQCFLGDINPETGKPYGVPLWTAIMTPEQERDIQDTAYRKQFEKKP